MAIIGGHRATFSLLLVITIIKSASLFELVRRNAIYNVSYLLGRREWLAIGVDEFIFFVILEVVVRVLAEQIVLTIHFDVVHVVVGVANVLAAVTCEVM